MPVESILRRSQIAAKIWDRFANDHSILVEISLSGLAHLTEVDGDSRFMMPNDAVRDMNAFRDVIGIEMGDSTAPLQGLMTQSGTPNVLRMIDIYGGSIQAYGQATDYFAARFMRDMYGIQREAFQAMRESLRCGANGAYSEKNLRTEIALIVLHELVHAVGDLPDPMREPWEFDEDAAYGIQQQARREIFGATPR